MELDCAREVFAAMAKTYADGGTLPHETVRQILHSRVNGAAEYAAELRALYCGALRYLAELVEAEL